MSQEKSYKKRPIKKAQLSAASEVLHSLLKNSKSPLGQQFVRWRLWQNWEKVVGCEIAKHTIPVGFNKGVLFVWVDHPARLQELTFMVKTFRDRVNDFQGYQWARSIRFTLDRKSVPEPEETKKGLRDFLSK